MFPSVSEILFIVHIAQMKTLKIHKTKYSLRPIIDSLLEKKFSLKQCFCIYLFIYI